MAKGSPYQYVLAVAKGRPHQYVLAVANKSSHQYILTVSKESYLHQAGRENRHHEMLEQFKYLLREFYGGLYQVVIAFGNTGTVQRM